MTAYTRQGNLEIEARGPDEFISHCDNIAHILANTMFMWNARRKIRRYLELTGAETIPR